MKVITATGTTKVLNIPPGAYDLAMVSYDSATRIATFQVTKAPEGSDVAVGTIIQEKMR